MFCVLRLFIILEFDDMLYYMIFCVFVIWDYDKIRCYINIMILYDII